MTPISIAGGIFVRGDRLLLAKRAPHKAHYPNCWDFVGGHVESGETIEQALIREAQEEIGLTPLHFTSAGTILEPAPTSSGAIYHLFTVTQWSGGEPKLLGDEHTEIRWFTQDEAYSLRSLAPQRISSLLTRMNQHALGRGRLPNVGFDQ